MLLGTVEAIGVPAHASTVLALFGFGLAFIVIVLEHSEG
nr:hypothetical protein SHINE37_44147 [Rhizobiaceae bacterium]